MKQRQQRRVKGWNEGAGRRKQVQRIPSRGPRPGGVTVTVTGRWGIRQAASSPDGGLPQRAPVAGSEEQIA